MLREGPLPNWALNWNWSEMEDSRPDDKERALVESFDRGDWRSVENTEREKRKLRDGAGRALQKVDVDYALEPSPWDLGNEVLYSLCRVYPKHDRKDAVLAKVWLIGRAYAAAIERRKNATNTSDDFYQAVVGEKIMRSEVDQWLASLPEPDRIMDPWCELGRIVTVHKRLLDLFFDITGLEKRSLASKYLHFHRPDLFFIYDSRAKGAITKITPSIREIRKIQCEEGDAEYLALVRRCQWLKDDVAQRFNVSLTPRQVDKILLGIADKTKRAPVVPYDT
jgi:hypothetical protein